ncbi:hypothetical protein LTR49_025575 [Elasticomyces elasticus]|nr:hypothetical protein LTR49_025575 [Elasticomyces elasticus]
MNGYQDGQGLLIGIEDDVFAENATTDDTVDGMAVITFADELGSGYFGPTSNTAFFSHISNAVKEAALPIQDVASSTSGITTAYVSRPHSPKPAPKETTSCVSKSQSSDVFALPGKQNVIILVDRFFDGMGLLFPYIHRKAIIDGLHDMNARNSHGVRRSWLCLVNTIMAFSTCVTYGSDGQKDACATQANVYFQRALRLLPTLACKPANLEALQGLLLVTQYSQGTQHSAQTYKFQGLTIRAAFQLGVHCTMPGENYSLLEQEVRTRCWYMCYVLDK